MVKLLATGDLHFRGTSPRARLDDFTAALVAKLQEVFDLARNTRCAGIVIPGDIVDTPGIALPTLVELCLVLAKSPCPIYAVPGNHDLWGGSPDTVSRTPYGALTRFGLICDLASNRYLVDGIALTGHAYDPETDRDITQYASGTSDSTGDRISPCVHVAHGMVLQREPGHALTRYTLMRDIAALDNAPDVLVVGHEHLGFGAVRVGRTTFVNPGALCRLSATPAEIARRVKVCLLSVSNDFSQGAGTVDIRTELITLTSARPGNEVLSRDHLTGAHSAAADSDDFVALLATGVEPEKLELRQVVEEVAKAQGVSREVLSEALKRIAQASEEADYASSVL